MALFPGALPAAGTAVTTDTLLAAGHTALHNTSYDEIRAIATKIGTGASTPTNNKVLRGNGTGTSTWAQVDVTTDITGTLPVANGGAGSTNLTFPGGPDTLVARGSTDTLTNKTLTTPTIGSFINATHNHTNSAGGGQLTGSTAIIDGTITPAELTAGTGAVWDLTSWIPTLSGQFTNGDWTKDCRFVQIGKRIDYIMSLTSADATPMAGGAGEATFSLPVTSITYPGTATLQTIGEVQIYDTSTGNLFMGYVIWVSTTTANIRWFQVAGTAISNQAVNSTTPITWATSDEIVVRGWYYVP